ncbi:MAG TPA: PmoA family protein [Pyrinomonadaceae bacterium]|nr:PmoA family protein [Pyrinomonadaceae bacterium]
MMKMKLFRPGFLAATLLLVFQVVSVAQVRITKDEAGRRVDIKVDGKPFTSYLWSDKLKVPVLYPLRTTQGTIVTRGFPLDPRPGERVDHPHHIGLWFNYGSVNGVDFWNNSTALPPEQQQKMGMVVHRRIVKATGGKDRGELAVEMDWVMPDGQPILQESTTFVFYAGPSAGMVDRITKLTALTKQVVFQDNKEGMLGMRVRRELEQPSNEPLVFTDSSGRATTVKVLDNTGVSGLYRSSEGKSGDEVWGTRGRWTMLSGKVDKEAITLAILDHPSNPGFPTYWHARGYGLFAANPLGQEVFSNGKEKLNFTLEPKQSVTFRYRVLIVSGPTTPDEIELEYKKFSNEVK